MSLFKVREASVSAFPARPLSSNLVMILRLISHIKTHSFSGCTFLSNCTFTSSSFLAPCIPHDVTTNVQCEADQGSVSWGPSNGAESYIAVATGLDGHGHECLTNTTSCTWNDLHCGEEYTVVVRAKDGNCTSLPSNSSVIYMGMLWNT